MSGKKNGAKEVEEIRAAKEAKKEKVVTKDLITQVMVNMNMSGKKNGAKEVEEIRAAKEAKKGKSGNKGSQHSGDGEYEYEWNEEWSQGGGGKKGGKGGKGKGGHGKGSKSCCQAIDLIMETDFGFGGNQGLYKYNGTINDRGYWIMENKNTAK